MEAFLQMKVKELSNLDGPTSARILLKIVFLIEKFCHITLCPRFQVWWSQEFSLLTMPFSVMKWRVETGMFSPAHKTRFINEKSVRVVGLSFTFRFGIHFVFVVLMLFACGCIELNPGPKKRSSCYNFSVCNWNLNSITAPNFAKNGSCSSL